MIWEPINCCSFFGIGPSEASLKCTWNFFKNSLRGEYEQLTTRGTSYLKSDIINNMDHMRISGNAPSSVILGQTK